MLTETFKRDLIKNGWKADESEQWFDIFPEDGTIFQDVIDQLELDPSTEKIRVLVCATKEFVDEEYPFEEGDDYWTLEYTDKAIAVKSCWDNESEELYDKHRTYYASLDELIRKELDRFGEIEVHDYSRDVYTIKK